MASHGVLQKDDNGYPVAGGVSSADATQVLNSRIDPVTGRLLVNSASGSGTVTSITAGTGLTATPSNPITTSGTILLDSKLAPLDTLGSAGQSIRVNAGATALEYYTPGAGSGTVTSVSVVTANGFAGTVATATTTPAITLTTSINSPVLAGNGTAISAATTTGSGSTVVLATSPTLVTPVLGVASATTINKVTITAPATGSTLTIADGKTLTASNTLTFTGTDGSSVAFGTGGTVLYGNQTITLSGDVTGSGTTAITTTVAKIAGTTVSGTTGSTNVVFSTSPTLTTPTLGVASATSINKVAITAPATSATLTISDGKTLTVNNTLTLAGTDSTTMTFPSTSATIARTDAAQSFSGNQSFALVIQTVQAITVTSNAGTADVSHGIQTFTNSSAATMAITLATASAIDGQLKIIRIYDFSGVAQTIGWTNTENSTVSVPTTSNGSTTLPVTVGFQFNNSTSKWRCIASA